MLQTKAWVNNKSYHLEKGKELHFETVVWWKEAIQDQRVLKVKETIKWKSARVINHNQIIKQDNPCKVSIFMDLARDKDYREFKLHHKSYEFNNKCKVKTVTLKRVILQENLERMEPPQLKELPNLKRYQT